MAENEVRITPDIVHARGVAGDHWFDRLNKTLAPGTSRRTIVGSVVAVAARLALGGLVAAGKGRNKPRNRKKKRHKRSPRPPCSGGACSAVREWLGDEAQVGYCEFICRQCDGDDPREFCIDRSSGEPIADCCEAGETCCGGDRCCPDYCCDGVCVPSREACCPADEAGFCDPFRQRCCPGIGCVEGNERPDPACGENCVGSGLACCHGSCVGTNTSQYHCGGCDQPCEAEAGKRCCDGGCFVVNGFDNAHCGSCQPCPAGRQCCHGRCIDPLVHRCCGPAFPPNIATCPRPAVCCMLAGGPACCGSCCTLSDGTPACCG